MDELGQGNKMGQIIQNHPLNRRESTMIRNEYSFFFEIYDSETELSADDNSLLQEARRAIDKSYAPYSQFRVGAAARLAKGGIVSGANQENASFPAGICAERVLLSAVSSLYPGLAIDTIAISYENDNGPSEHPISPCGICRQSLQEFERRVQHPIRLILGGREGKVYVIPKASWLMPLAFTSDELNK